MKQTLKVTLVAGLLAVSYPLMAQQALYQNPDAPFAERVEDLLGRMSLQEKIDMMTDYARPIERLGVKPYNWWNEALHGVARAGLGTVFPQPIGLAATFNPEAIHTIYTAVSDEGRAKNSRTSASGSYERYQGLTMWTPTVNIYRDPRWGRGIETYGEDPYLASVLGVEVVKGLQGPADQKYDKMHACAKHFAVHSGPEWNRHSYNAENIKPRDLHETYLPPFEALVREANVQEVMCAYNAFEGEPCCGSTQLLQQILREEWGFEGIVVADCGAIADFFRDKGHKTHPDAPTASADGVRAGTDLDCGSSYRSLMEAVQKGLISEAELDVSVRRLLMARFRLGEMDNNQGVSWAEIPYSVVACQEHDSLALDAARQSMTLLHNPNSLLPLKRGGQTIAVMGPNANDSVMQWGNYNGLPPRTVTILEGIRSALTSTDQLIYEPGCGLVERTLLKSVFNQFATPDGVGFTARYWNNRKREGEPVTTTHVSTPFRFCTMGATVFAPGVNLTDFSATYSSLFTPKESGEVLFETYSCGSGRFVIDGVEVKSYANNHGGRTQSYLLKVEAGKTYQIEIHYESNSGEAQLNFDLGVKERIDIEKSVAAVAAADVVLFVGGISPALEGEEMGVDLPGFFKGDRTDIELPAVQRELIEALHKSGKKVVLVNCSGSPIGLEPEVERCEAILQAWYPGQSGGTAVADVLFGEYNPSGRLPVTFYKNVAQLPHFEDYNMTNRTYRYLQEKPLFPFGYGLSYATFAYQTPVVEQKSVKVGEGVKVSIDLTNRSNKDGEEVVQLYLRKKGDVEGPTKTLRAFKRQLVKANETVQVQFELTGKQLHWWNEATNSMNNHAGVYELLLGGSSADEQLKRVEITIK